MPNAGAQLCVFCRRHPVDPGLAALLQRALQAAGPGALGRRYLSGGRATGDATPTTKVKSRRAETIRTIVRPLPLSIALPDFELLMTDTLTIVDNRTGKKYELPIPGRHHPRDGSAPNQGRPGRLRPDDVRPGVHEHRELPERDHLHRRRQGHPALSRVSDRAARRAERFPRDGLSDSVRRAADRAAAADVDARDHQPYDASREHQEVHGGVPVRRAPDGHLPEHRRRAVRPSTPTPSRSSTRRLADAARRTGSSPRCRASPPRPTATASAGRTSIRTTI